MKKTILLYILFGLFFNTIFGQYVPPQNNYNVTVTKKKSFSESFNDGLRAGAANKQANAAAAAARAEAMKDNYSKINIDELIDNSDKYKYVLVEKVTGWMVNENIKTLKNTLEGSNIYEFVNMSGPKRFWTHKKLPEVILKSPESVLRLSFHREAQGQYTRTSKVALMDSDDNVIYQAEHKNIDYATMLIPLLNKYVTSKEDKALKNKLARDEAIKKLRDAKELLELDVLTQEEYNSLVKEYKAMLLSDG